jgi:hypothetical protein
MKPAKPTADIANTPKPKSKMTQSELEAYDAMMADRDRWREKLDRQKGFELWLVAKIEEMHETAMNLRQSAIEKEEDRRERYCLGLLDAIRTLRTEISLHNATAMASADTKTQTKEMTL